MISKELYDFVSDFSEKQLKQSLDYDKLSSETTLDDINIDDLDLDVMMQKFIEKFNIDHSQFNKKLYFGLGIPLIDDNISSIRKVIGKPKWMPLPKDELKPFTLGVLESAIKTGVLK